MNVKCINKPDKFKNLTREKDYEAVADGDAYVLVNDAGFRARYAKSYFREVAAAPTIPPPPPAPVVVPLTAVTFRNFLEGGVFDFTVNTGGRRREETIRFSLSRSSISCGIYELSGIREIGNVLASLYERIPNPDFTYSNFVNRCMDELITTIFSIQPMATLLMSDFIDSDNDHVHEYLNENASYSAHQNNPNSGNDIILWVFNAS